MALVARDKYKQLVQELDVPVLCCPNFKLLEQKYCVPADTLCSIFCQLNQVKVIRSHHVHKARTQQYCDRYRSGVGILQLCSEADFPPCLMIRRLLEHLLQLSKQRISEVLKDPTLLASVASSTGSTCSWRADSELLARMSADIVRAARADRSYSAYSDMGRTLAGLEHEAALQEALQNAGVPFWSEAQLREQGLYKTPDAWLQVPIAVRSTRDSAWHVVHWVDSKACFGDDRLHSQQLEGQYHTYVNRYGPGMVIYWYGHIEDVGASDPEVLVTHRFPAAEDIRLLPSCSNDPRANSTVAACQQ